MSTGTTESETGVEEMRTKTKKDSKAFNMLETDEKDSIDILVYLNDSKECVKRNKGFFRAEDLPKSLLYPAIENNAKLYLYDDVFAGGPIKYSLDGEDIVIGRVVSNRALRKYDDLKKIHDSKNTEFLNDHYGKNLFEQEIFYEEEVPFQDLSTTNRTVSEG